MQITFLEKENTTIALIVSNDIIMQTAEDAAELLMNCLYQDADSLIAGAQPSCGVF
jgi:hypothetical protein